MTGRCPRCGNPEVQSSRARGPIELFARVIGFPPRRCTACGWRGMRPRLIFGARKASNPSIPKVAVPPPPPPPPPPSPAEEEKRRHHHHHRHHIKKQKRQALQALVLALVLGVGAGLIVYSCAQ